MVSRKERERGREIEGLPIVLIGLSLHWVSWNQNASLATGTGDGIRFFRRGHRVTSHAGNADGIGAMYEAVNLAAVHHDPSRRMTYSQLHHL
jgi:hypothetical protein